MTIVRVAGAFLGALLGLAAIVIAVRLDAILIPNPADSPIAVVFGPDGIAHGEPIGTILVWAVGPLAAAIAGFVFAPSAVRHVDGSGLWMGAATYVIAIGIAPIALAPGAAEDGIDAVRSLGAIPFLWLFAGAALGPLLAVCLLAGPLWATVLRVTTAGPARAEPSAVTLPLWPVVALGIAVLAGWAIVGSLLSVAGNATFD